MHIVIEKVKKSQKKSMKETMKFPGTFQTPTIWIVWFKDLKHKTNENQERKLEKLQTLRNENKELKVKVMLQKATFLKFTGIQK